MGANPEPTDWMEQILATSDLSALLPAAIGWIHGTGCRASDLSKEAAGELAAKAQRRVEHLERDGDEDDQAVWEAATLKVSAEGGLFRHDAAAS